MTTKHDIFKLTFKEHPVFKDKNIIVDSEDDVVLWIDKETGETSFGGKYFKLYNEIKLVETLMNFVYASHDFLDVHSEEEGNVELLKERLEKALDKFDSVFVNEGSWDYKIK